ncbi:unnamed protein product, partial [Trichobilharzia regenti]
PNSEPILPISSNSAESDNQQTTIDSSSSSTGQTTPSTAGGAGGGGGESNQQEGDSTDSGNRRIGEIVLGLNIAPGEEPLPQGWELARTASGRKFFINHNEHTTTWDDPRITRSNNQLINGSLLTHEAQRHLMKDLGPLPVSRIASISLLFLVLLVS